MNSIQKINTINQKELAENISDSASWHAEYSDTPYIYIGFIPQELAEADIVAIFSQYGVPTHINLVKDRDTGASRGFCYLKYEDHRSCVLAVDNFNGLKVLDKRLKVDHVYYQLREGQNEDDFKVDYTAAIQSAKANIQGVDKKLIANKPQETDDPVPDDDFQDPMEQYLKELGRKRHRSHRERHAHESGSSHRRAHKESSSSRHPDLAPSID